MDSCNNSRHDRDELCGISCKHGRVSKSKAQRKVARRHRKHYTNAHENNVEAPALKFQSNQNYELDGHQSSASNNLYNAMPVETLHRNEYSSGNILLEAETSPNQNSDVEHEFLPECDDTESENESLPNFNFVNGTVQPSPCNSDSSSQTSTETDQSDVDDVSLDNYFEISLAKKNASGKDGVQTKENYVTFSDAQSGCVAIVLTHHDTLNFYGKAFVSVISGCIDIFGYSMKSDGEESVPVYASESLGCIQIKTKYPYWKTSQHWRNVASSLEKYFPNKSVTVSDLSKVCNDTSVVVILRKHDLAYAVDFACQYIKNVMPPLSRRLHYMANKGFMISDSDEFVLKVNDCFIFASEVIETATHASVEEQSSAPIILVYGTRAIGKSTAIRYFVNTMLSNVPKIYYLDVDPGQAEFTPPGCVSLTEVTKPLLGPPFTHPKTPLKMAFYGSISIKEGELFCKCMNEVVTYFKRNCGEYPLIINTCGWLKGLGLDCLKYLRELISPSIEIEVSHEVNPRPSEHVRTLLERAKERNQPLRLKIEGFPLKRSPDKSPSATTRRDLSILSYFGRCQLYYGPLQTMNALKPFFVRIEDIALHGINDVLPNYALQVFLNSFVALCIVDEAQILLYVDKDRQYKRLTSDADFSKCVGFGFVRAIDLEKNILYVVTPEPFNVLRHVNTLVKGSIQMPNSLYEHQGVHNVPMPYVKQMISKKPATSKMLKKPY